MTNEAPELLPCPFCGGEVSITADPDHSTAVILTHDADSCPIDDHWSWHGSVEEAVSAWNTRADIALPPVKPLAWVKGHWSSTVRDVLCSAPDGFGNLYLVRKGKHFSLSHCGHWRYGMDSVDEAKAAAQSDLERRARSLFVGGDA